MYVQTVQETFFGCITVVAAELAKGRVQCRLDLPCDLDSATFYYLIMCCTRKCYRDLLRIISQLWCAMETNQSNYES